MDELERELLKIEAVADLLAVIDAHELERNTLVSFGVIVQEACNKIRECLKGE
jgi:hypothetical protein